MNVHSNLTTYIQNLCKPKHFLPFSGGSVMNQSRGMWFYLTYMSLLIINSTNRNNSGTAQLIQKVETLCLSFKIDFKTIQLEEFSKDLSNPNLYHEENWSIEMIDYQEEVIIPSDKFLFIIPEYNGSFPGILKLWIDVLSVRKGVRLLNLKVWACRHLRGKI